MRLLFEDRVFASTYAAISVTQIGLPSALKRDLYFLFADSGGGTLVVYVYPSRASAIAAVAPYSDCIQSKTIGLSVSPQSVSFSSGTLSGLVITGTFSAVPPDDGFGTPGPGVIWGYDSAFGLVTAENIRTRLLEYAGTNEALEGIRTEQITIYDASQVVSLLPCAVNIVPGDFSADPSAAAGALTPGSIAFEIDVATVAITRAEVCATRCRRYADMIASILADEGRSSYGEVLTLKRRGMTAPAVAAQNATISFCTLTITAHYHSVFRDDIFPRT